jgi:TolA-binding protein
MTAFLRAALVAAAILLPGASLAQMDSREGIALQNQILQLRQELEALRRGGLAAPSAPAGGGGFLGAPVPSGRAPAGAPQGELVAQLLDRVARLEEELRSVRGRAEQSEFRERQLRERLEKLEGDIDFRLQGIEGQRRGDAAPPAAPPGRASPAAPATPAQPALAPVSRPPQRALAEGQAALARRDFAAAETAAREVIASREAARQADGQILLGDALLGRRDFAGAAVAYDDALRRNRGGSRAPEAMLGIANALIGLNNNGDACAQLNDLRRTNPTLSGPVAERAAEARRRARCG